MLKFELLHDDGDILTYRYLCEGSSRDSGEMDFSRSKGDVTAVRKADKDKSGFYWRHLADGLRNLFHAGDFKRSGMIAWH